MSKVFIVRLCVIQFTRYILFAAANFDIITQLSAFVKHFFQVFANFFRALFLSCASLERLRILADIIPFVKRFFQFFSKYFDIKIRGPFGPLLHILIVRLHPQSGHSHHRFSYKQQRMHRRYPHPGMRRNYAPADSSAEQLLHGSWV